MRTSTLFCILFCGLTGCPEGDTALIKLKLTMAYAFADRAQLTIHSAGPENTQACTALVGQALGGSQLQPRPVFDSGPRPLCEFLDGTVALKSIPSGTHAYLAQIWDKDGLLAFTGCAPPKDLETQGKEITVTLSQTTAYTAKYSGTSASCSVIDACQGKCGAASGGLAYGE